jgi:hypothetical protein
LALNREFIDNETPARRDYPSLRTKAFQAAIPTM